MGEINLIWLPYIVLATFAAGWVVGWTTRYRNCRKGIKCEWGWNGADKPALQETGRE